MTTINGKYSDELNSVKDELNKDFVNALSKGNLELALRLIQQVGKILSFRDREQQKEISCFHIPPHLNALVLKSANTHTALFPQICTLVSGVLSIAGGVLGFGVIGASEASAKAFTALSTGLQGAGGGVGSVGKIGENHKSSERVLTQHEVDEVRRHLNQTEQTGRESGEQESKFDQMVRELLSQQHNLAQQILRKSSNS